MIRIVTQVCQMDFQRSTDVVEKRAGVKIRITDDGGGIPNEIKEKVFDPFFTTKDVGQGTGLGLSVAYGIIQFHQGRIFFEVDPGVGTTFHIEIPSKIQN